MKAKPTQYDSNQQSTFNLYDLFILINNNIYIYLSLQEIKQTFVRLYLAFNLFHAAFFYLREIIHPPPPPHPCHVPVTLSREICTECFERLVSNILQGDKMPHFLYCV